jgi:hypothetical protein
VKHVHRHAFGELASWRIRNLRKAATRRRLKRWAKRVAKFISVGVERRELHDPNDGQLPEG